MVNSKDIAQKAGVSIATVSRVFRSPELVTPKTRELVLDIARQMNYSPNYMASSLKSNKSHTIGLLISDIKNPFYMYIAEVLAQRLKSENYRLVLAFCSEDLVQEEESINTLLSSRIEGLLFTPTCYNSSVEKMLSGNNVYSLQLYRYAYQSMDSLVIDDCYGSYLATRHLLEHGHTRILLLDGYVQVPTGRDDGYRKAFSEFNLPVDENLIVHIPFNKDNTNDIERLIVATSASAVIPVSSDLGLQTLNAIKRLNLLFPNDISIVVYDDQLWAEVMGITTIMHPVDEIGNKVGEILLQHVNGQTSASTVKTIITPYLNKRNSVKQL
jgi:DNA-binding LacI/PurR family transcriptional regulator